MKKLDFEYMLLSTTSQPSKFIYQNWSHNDRITSTYNTEAMPTEHRVAILSFYMLYQLQDRIGCDFWVKLMLHESLTNRWVRTLKIIELWRIWVNTNSTLCAGHLHFKMNCWISQAHRWKLYNVKILGHQRLQVGNRHSWSTQKLW